MWLQLINFIAGEWLPGVSWKLRHNHSNGCIKLSYLIGYELWKFQLQFIFDLGMETRLTKVFSLHRPFVIQDWKSLTKHLSPHCPTTKVTLTCQQGSLRLNEGDSLRVGVSCVPKLSHRTCAILMSHQTYKQTNKSLYAEGLQQATAHVFRALTKRCISEYTLQSVGRLPA